MESVRASESSFKRPRSASTESPVETVVCTPAAQRSAASFEQLPKRFTSQDNSARTESIHRLMEGSAATTLPGSAQEVDDTTNSLTVDNAQFAEMLLVANQANDKTRELLKHRGNLRLDIQLTNHESSRRATVVRYAHEHLKFEKNETEDQVAQRAALACQMQAGLCDEFAYVAFSHLCEKLKNNQTAEIVVKDIDATRKHTYVRFNGGHANDQNHTSLIVDPWAQGSPVLTRHSKFDQHDRPEHILLTATGSQGQRHYQLYNHYSQQVSQPKIHGYLEQLLAGYTKKGFTLSPDSVWEESPSVKA